MHLLHPIYLIIFGILLVVFAMGDRIARPDAKKILFVVAALMIVMAGGRQDVGADFPVYSRMYYIGFPNYTTYGDIWDKALFRPNSMEIEWLYVLLNKLLFDFGMPFFVVTFIMATGSVLLQLNTFNNFSELPVLSMLFYFMAIYFFTDSGQMRQGMGTAICVFSVRYIIRREVWKYLICIFFALGMHKSTVIFIPAYWLATLPLTGRQWIPILVGSVLLAPFEIYNYFGGFFSTLAPQDVSSAFEGYSNDKYYGNEMKSGLGDAINIFFILFILFFDKTAQKKIPYFEYFRNMALFGYCLYYIFRGNTIFATRLPGVYIAMAGYFAVPGIMMAVRKETQAVLKTGLIAYFILFCFAFSRVNAQRAGFTADRYNNILW